MDRTKFMSLISDAARRHAGVRHGGLTIERVTYVPPSCGTMRSHDGRSEPHLPWHRKALALCIWGSGQPAIGYLPGAQGMALDRVRTEGPYGTWVVILDGLAVSDAPTTADAVAAISSRLDRSAPGAS